MKRTADVKSVDAIRDAKAALAEFRETVNVALGEANAEAQRTLWWLQNDQTTYWRSEVRRRNEKLNQAKSELYRAQLAAMDEHVRCTEQRKMVERAQRALEEAMQRVEKVKQWIRVLDRELMIYKAQCQSIARAVEVELPKAEGRLEQYRAQLDRYLQLRPEAPRTEQTTNRPSASRDEPENAP
jgi:hypothetical protein